MNPFIGVFEQQFEEHLFHRAPHGGCFLDTCINHMRHENPRNSLSLVFEEVLTRVKGEHHQTFLPDVLDKYHSD